MDPYAMVATAVAAVAGAASTIIGILWRQRLADERTKVAELSALQEQCKKEREEHLSKLNALHDQRVKDHDVYEAKLAALHEQRLKEHEQHEAQLVALHQQYLKQSKEMFDELLSSDKNLKQIMWISGKDTRDLTQSIKAFTERQDENTRSIRQAIEQLSESIASKP